MWAYAVYLRANMKTAEGPRRWFPAWPLLSDIM